MATQTAQQTRTIKRAKSAKPVETATAPSLPLFIRSRVDEVDSKFRDDIRAKLEQKLGKFAQQIERVSVTVEDVNGPKGGDDTVIRVQVAASGLPSIVVEEHATSLGEALILVSRAVERAVRRALEKAGHASHSARKARGTRTNGRAALPEPAEKSSYGGGGPHNVKANRSGMVAAFETSTTKPTRKSTRGSANRAKAATPLYNEKLRQLHSPEATARRSIVRGRQK